jgi:hypothetical protein
VLVCPAQVAVSGLGKKGLFGLGFWVLPEHEPGPPALSLAPVDPKRSIQFAD